MEVHQKAGQMSKTALEVDHTPGQIDRVPLNQMAKSQGRVQDR